jgi:DNA topoisomerase VI subunit A
MTRILQLVHEICTKGIHVTKRDLFYTDVKLLEARALGCATRRCQLR